VAAKLEQETKRLDCTLVVSLDTVDAVAAPLAADTARADVAIAGRQEPLPVVVFRHRADLSAVVSKLR
jgi:hypothetical protein